MTIGTFLTGLFMVAIGVGISFLIIAHGMPSHSDQRRASELTLSYGENQLSWTAQQRKLAEAEIISLRTPKWELYRAGLGMCLAAPVLLLAVIRFRLWDIRNLRAATTPQSRLGILGLASAAWLALLPALLLGVQDEFTQDDLTPTMDTGHGAFFVFLPPIFVAVWIVIIVFYRYVVLRNVQLPANLWYWDRAQPYRSLVCDIFFGLLGSILIALIAWATYAFPWSLPSLLVGLYVLLSSRAALQNRDLSATAPGEMSRST